MKDDIEQAAQRKGQDDENCLDQLMSEVACNCANSKCSGDPLAR
jgi:hypothetical protein